MSRVIKEKRTCLALAKRDFPLTFKIHLQVSSAAANLHAFVASIFLDSVVGAESLDTVASSMSRTRCQVETSRLKQKRAVDERIRHEQCWDSVLSSICLSY